LIDAQHTRLRCRMRGGIQGLFDPARSSRPLLQKEVTSYSYAEASTTIEQQSRGRVPGNIVERGTLTPVVRARGLGEVVLRVRDMARAIAFYRDVLGLTVLRTFDGRITFLHS